MIYKFKDSKIIIEGEYMDFQLIAEIYNHIALVDYKLIKKLGEEKIKKFEILSDTIFEQLNKQKEHKKVVLNFDTEDFKVIAKYFGVACTAIEEPDLITIFNTSFENVEKIDNQLQKILYFLEK